jgi:hypothetical protein
LLWCTLAPAECDRVPSSALLDGKDLRRQPIEERKRLLAKLLRGSHLSIIPNETFEEDGAIGVPEGLPARLRGHRFKAAWLALPLGALAELAEDQEPDRASGQARSGRGPEPLIRGASIMSEEDDPLALDGNWHRLCISSDASAMEQWGPNLKVSIAAVTQQGATLAHHEVGALIDTGSKPSCISPRLAPKMEGGLRGVRSLSHIYGPLEGPPTIRGLVRFKNGVEFIRDFSVLDQLAPYDVLIGRDILRECRMYIDIGRGHFRLYFANRTPR